MVLSGAALLVLGETHHTSTLFIKQCLNSNNFTVGDGKSGHCGVVGVGGDGGHGGGLGGGEGGGSHSRQKFPHSLPCRVLPFEKV